MANAKANQPLQLKVEHDGVDTDSYDVVRVITSSPLATEVMGSRTRADIEADPNFDPTAPFTLDTSAGLPRGNHTLFVVGKNSLEETPSDNQIVAIVQKPVPPVIVAVVGVVIPPTP